MKGFLIGVAVSAAITWAAMAFLLWDVFWVTRLGDALVVDRFLGGTVYLIFATGCGAVGFVAEDSRK